MRVTIAAPHSLSPLEHFFESRRWDLVLVKRDAESFAHYSYCLAPESAVGSVRPIFPKSAAPRTISSYGQANKGEVSKSECTSGNSVFGHNIIVTHSLPTGSDVAVQE